MFGIDNLPQIIEQLAKLGVNITEERLKTLKWRVSDEGKKYYSEQENIDFYKALSKGKVRTLDLIRKEKQKRINDMIKKISIVILPIMCCLLISCGIIGSPTRRLDESSIKEIEKTYQLQKQEVQTEDGKAQVDENWYMVHKDHIVTHNENQDNLIKVLQRNQELQEQSKKIENRINILYGVSGSCFVVILILALILIVSRKK